MQKLLKCICVYARQELELITKINTIIEINKLNLCSLGLRFGDKEPEDYWYF